MVKFNCSGCGLCCGKIGPAVLGARESVVGGNKDLFVGEMAAFPHSFDASGRCENLEKDNTCRIYSTRPDICNVDIVFTKFGGRIGISREDFFKHNELVCGDLIKNHSK